MIRPRPGWLVVVCAAAVMLSAWFPWLTTDGGHASGIGGIVGNLPMPDRFNAGQLIVLLASTLIVAGAMTARGLSVRVSAAAALALSLCIAALTYGYYHLYVHPPNDAGWGLYVGAGAAVAATLCSVWALVAALTTAPR